jgi:hypothetical protein
MFRTVLWLATSLTAFSVGAHESSRIETRSYWGNTGLRVERYRIYRVQVKWDHVVDGDGWLGVPVNTLNGWPDDWHRLAAAPLFWLRRRPFDPWFAMIATVDRQKPFRLLPDESSPPEQSPTATSWSRPFVAPATGELVCYFNDAPWAYWNNHGSVTLTLEQLRKGVPR